MTDIFITDPSPFEEDISVEKSLRPVKFDEFIENLRTDQESWLTNACRSLLTRSGSTGSISHRICIPGTCTHYAVYDTGYHNPQFVTVEITHCDF